MQTPTNTTPETTTPQVATPAPTEAAPAPAPAPAEKLYAGKYKSVEEMEAGYKALETRLGSTPTPAPETPASPEATPAPEAAPVTEEAQSVLAQAGIDFDALSSEYLASGQLSPESLEKLNKAGFPQSVVDSYIAGAQSQAQQVVTDIYNHVGGEDNFKALLEWGGENLTEAEVKAFNASLDAPDINQSKLAIDGLRAKMVAAGVEPKLVTPTNAANATTQSSGYKTQSDMITAMNKRDANGRKLYGTDPSYTQQVEAMVKASNF